MAAVQELTPALGASAACHALGVPRGTPAWQRAHLRRMAFIGPLPRSTARPRPPLALDALENQVLLDTLNSERFADTAPAAIHATLLDEGRYLAPHGNRTSGRRISRRLIEFLRNLPSRTPPPVWRLAGRSLLVAGAHLEFDQPCLLDAPNIKDVG